MEVYGQKRLKNVLTEAQLMNEHIRMKISFPTAKEASSTINDYTRSSKREKFACSSSSSSSSCFRRLLESRVGLVDLVISGLLSLGQLEPENRWKTRDERERLRSHHI